jgi:hypothetical protein
MTDIHCIRYLAEQSVEQDGPGMTITLDSVEDDPTHQYLQGW